jgi:hypothetical protein
MSLYILDTDTLTLAQRPWRSITAALGMARMP